MDQTGSKRTQTCFDQLQPDQSAPNWLLDGLKPVLTVLLRTRPGLPGFEQLKPDSNWNRAAQNGSIRTRSTRRAKTGFDRLKPYQTGPDRLKPDQTRPEWLKPVLAGSNQSETGFDQIKPGQTGSNRF